VSERRGRRADVTGIGVKGQRLAPDERMIMRVATALLSLGDEHTAGYDPRPAKRR
jgi:hypothetical protein